VRLRLRGIDPKEFPLLTGGRQLLDGDVLTVEQRRLKSNGWFGGYTLPYVGGDMNPWLAPEPLVQSDDPEIIATARAIVGDERDVLRAARRIHEWVFENVEKRSSAGVPSAVEVLKTRSGDCNEHTVLYVALARAAGIPTRLAVGLVWANARGAGPGLYYHAWPEVYAGVSGIAAFTTPETSGGWYALDPTLGQEPADTGHLRFLVGGLERQVDLLKLIGKLEVEVLPYETPFATAVQDTAGALEAANRSTSSAGEMAP
jgi:transglutaminase-like putative cysteine protease